VAELYIENENNHDDETLVDSTKKLVVSPKLFVKHNATEQERKQKKLTKLYSWACQKYQKYGNYNHDLGLVTTDIHEAAS
jgi:hypothetical protein